jgi:2-polyprenyl-6-methoxyphenol hydroxylase-like FAD-dependent oxidoreductase
MLESAGHDVAMFERFDGPSPVGSGVILQPTGLAVLRELGLSVEIHGLGKRIDNILGISVPVGKTVLNVNYKALGEGFHGLAVHRAALFDVLYRAAQSRNIPIVTGVDIAGVRFRDHRISIADAGDQVYGAFDLVVDASGARTRLRHLAKTRARRRALKYGALWGSFDWPDADFDPHTLEQRYVGAHTMIGVLPIGRHKQAMQDQLAFFWSIKARDFDQWRADGIEHWKHEVRSIWPETEAILSQISEPSQMTLAIYDHCTLRQPFGDKIVFLGDAAHSTSPQLGQGSNMALLDAWSLSEAIRTANTVDAALQQYAKSRRWHIRAFQYSSLALTPFYQSDSRILAYLRDLLFDRVARLPIAQRIVAGLISGMLAGPPTVVCNRGRTE